MSLDAKLIEAAKSGNVTKVRAALDGGADCECADVSEYGRTPLSLAAARGDGPVWTDGGDGPFLGDYRAVVQLLLERGAAVGSTDKDGITPLHSAVYYGRLECAQLLLERGADKEAKTVNGRTPLYFAAQGGRLECVQLLLERGADKEAKDKDGKAPLDVASKDAVRKLLRMPAELAAWLAQLQLLPHGPRLVDDYGLAFVSETADLSEADLKAAGLRKLEVKRFLEAAAKPGDVALSGELDGAVAEARAELASWLAALQLSAHGPRLAADYGLAVMSDCPHLDEADLTAAGLRKLEVKRFLAAAATLPAATPRAQLDAAAADASAELAAWLAKLRLTDHGPRLAADYGFAFVRECTDLDESELEAAGLRRLEVKRFLDAAGAQQPAEDVAVAAAAHEVCATTPPSGEESSGL